MLTWRQNQRVIKSKAPSVVATIGLSISGVRVFMPIVGEHRVNNMQYAVALRLRNDGERATNVTSIICFVSSPGSWGKTMAGAWPDGPAIPHEISTGDATWETSLEKVQRLYDYRRYGEEMPCDVGFRMTLSTGETRDVGPVRLVFPPESNTGGLREATAASEPTWIETLDNVHCPTCDARLVQRAGRFQGLDGPNGSPPPTYVADGNHPPRCPAGHEVPDAAALAAYNKQQGHRPPPIAAPVHELPPPS